ncbi:unnamed protein product [Linum tenue]|uniref:Annexin n=1 Tax=Linum tenue TaxID=586396 RepID=A0AAV0RVK2_9ROSI|nr:unnamed protein product [Linum tenue]
MSTSARQLVDEALKNGAEENAKKGLTRVIVTRADLDMKETETTFNNLYGATLAHRVEEATNGNYKDLLLTLITRDQTS